MRRLQKNVTKAVQVTFALFVFFVFMFSAKAFAQIPTAPTATGATSITATGFTANWGTVSDATGYYLDVATDSSFTNFVSGYNNLQLVPYWGGWQWWNPPYGVTGLNPGTTYYYRVRAYNGYGASGNSNTISVTTSGALTCAQPPTGLVSWWPGEGNADDIEGTNPGTLKASVTFAPGKVGQAFNVNGNLGNIVEVADAPSLNFTPTSPMTIELWAMRTAPQWAMHIVGKRQSCCCPGSPDINYQMCWIAGSGDFFGSYSGGVATGGGDADLPLNVWTHLAGTFDGSTLKIYVNGALAGTLAATLGPVLATPFTIGTSGTCGSANQGFVGLLDEVSLYNRALSAAEVQAVYSAGSEGKCKSSSPYSITDLTGTWQGNSLYSGRSGPLWIRTTMTVDSDGTFTDSYTTSRGLSGTGNGTWLISSNGLITLQADVSNHQCRMDAGKTIIGCTGTEPDGTADITVFTKTGVSYSLADLTGAWGVNKLGSGPAPFWLRGTSTNKMDGTYTESYTSSSGSSGNVTGTLFISPDGVITEQGIPSLQCTMDSGKTVAVCTSTESDGTTVLVVNVKKGSSYSLSDLASTWQVNSLGSGTSPYWGRWVLTINPDGTFVDSYTLSNGSSGTGGGTFFISPSGVITEQGIPSLQCEMDSGKTVPVCTSTDSDGTTVLSLNLKESQSEGPQQQCALTINKTGTGGGIVTADAGAINWSGNTGTASYPCGTTVTLTAVANGGSSFSDWQGGDSWNGSQCIVAMTGARNVTVTFNLIPANAPHIDLGAGAGVKSTTVQIPMTLTNVSGTSISAIGMDVGYDQTVLENPNAIIGPAGSAAGKSVSTSTPSSGVLRISVAGLNTNVIGNGIAAYVTFGIKATANPGSSTLKNTPSASDPQGNPVTVTGSNGTVNIITKPGDCNGDGTCDIAEVQSAINMYLGLKAAAACVDVNSDGKVDIAEVQKVINCYLGPFLSKIEFSPQRREGRRGVIFYLAVRGRQIKSPLLCQNMHDS